MLVLGKVATKNLPGLTSFRDTKRLIRVSKILPAPTRVARKDSLEAITARST